MINPNHSFKKQKYHPLEKGENIYKSRICYGSSPVVLWGGSLKTPSTHLNTTTPSAWRSLVSPLINSELNSLRTSGSFRVRWEPFVVAERKPTGKNGGVFYTLFYIGGHIFWVGQEDSRGVFSRLRLGRVEFNKNLHMVYSPLRWSTLTKIPGNLWDVRFFISLGNVPRKKQSS